MNDSTFPIVFHIFTRRISCCSVVLLIKNKSKHNAYEVSAILRVETVLYTGRVGDPVKRLNIDRLVKPGTVEEVRMEVSWEEYGPRLLNQCAFNIACLATVKDTNFEYFAQDDFRVRKPDIKIIVRTLCVYSIFYDITESVENETRINVI